MKLFLLVHEQNTCVAFGTNVTPFLSMDSAKATMRAEYDATLKEWNFDVNDQTEDYSCAYEENKARIRDDIDVENWWIEEHEIEVEMAIKVKGGLVQAIYANADVYPDVYDLDVSDYPDAGEQVEADDKEAELNKRIVQPGWRSVW